MYLSRFRADRAASSAADLLRLASAGTAHKLVWRWFADESEKKRDFLYRIDSGSPAVVWTLSAQPPANPGRPWEVESKAFCPDFESGDRLDFRVRINPTFRANSGDGAGKRHDVVMEEKRRLRTAGEDEPQAIIVQRRCTEWLTDRSVALGVEFEKPSLRADGYGVQRFGRPDDRRASVALVDLSGRLIVRDPALFLRAITKGIGPAKAFGCGLMLVKRA